jgi:membrane protein
MVSLISQTFSEFWEDKAERLGAALAYYAAFSMAPLLVIVIAMIDFVYDGDTSKHVQNQIAMMVGDNAAEAIIATIRGVKSSGHGVTATVISVITLIVGATGVFTQLQDAMNTIWEVTPKPRPFLRELFRTRLLSFAMVLGICFLLLISLVLSALLTAVSTYFSSMLPGTEFIWRIVDLAASFGVTMLLFTLIYRVLPDVNIAWRDVWIGAAATAVLFTIGKTLIGLYLGHSSFASAYGAAGSIMILLAWVYYSSQILLLGAEFTQVYANRYGSKLRPSRGASFLDEPARIHQGIPHRDTIQGAFGTRRDTRRDKGA